MLIYLRVTLILASGLGFFKGLGRGDHLSVWVFLFVCFIFWQNHCKAGYVGNGMA